MDDKQFVWLQPTDINEPPRFINLAQIAMASLESGKLVLSLTSGATVNVAGPAIEQLYLLIMSHSVMPDGEVPVTAIEQIKERLVRTP